MLFECFSTRPFQQGQLGANWHNAPFDKIKVTI